MEFFSAVGLSFAASPVWFYGEKWVAERYGTRLSEAVSCNDAEREKIKTWTASVACYFVQASLWALYSRGEDWIFDPANWVEHLSAIPAVSTPEGVARVFPFYILYLGYCWHSLAKDLQRVRASEEATSMQAMFIFHHLLTIFLVSLSIQYNGYRCGVITRLLFGPVDLVLYSSKILQIFAKDGKFPFTAMAALYVVNNVLWICLRIVGYGWMIYSAYGMLRVACAPHEWMMTCKPMMHGVPWMHTVLTFLLIGCGLMWLLQFIWGIALFEATVKYITKRGKVSGDSLDRGQGDGQAKLVAKAKDRKSRIKAALNEACTTPHTAAPHPSNEQKKAQ
jgi:hypothetical protein